MFTIPRIRPFVLFSAITCLFGPRLAVAELRDHLETAWAVAEARMQETVDDLPNTSTWTTVGSTINGEPTGEWGTTNTSRWRWHSGFWPGQLWLLSQKTGSPTWEQRAEDWSAPIATTGLRNHDIGFLLINAMGKGFLSHDDVSDPDGSYRNFAKDAILWGAGILNGYFNHNGVPVGMTRSWFSIEHPYPVCIDNLMNLELLLLAHELGGPREYFDNALTHARTSIDRHIRADGSTYHVVRHWDTEPGINDDWSKGDVRRKSTRQGFGDESTWSRGQAWAIHGLSTVYAYAVRLGDPDPSDILAAAEATADYFISELPHFTADPYNRRIGDFVPPSDFDAARGEPDGPWNDVNNNSVPNEFGVDGTDSKGRTYVNDRFLGMETFTLRDSSAAAIAASGLLELSELTKNPTKANVYRVAAESILESLISFDSGSDGPDYLNSIGESGDPGILRLGSEFWGGPYKSTSYGDMYFMEALARYEALSARELLESTLEVDELSLMPSLVFERHESSPALSWRIERATELDPENWETVAWKTGAGGWSGPIPVTETNLGNGTVRVMLAESSPAPDAAYYRVVTLSVATRLN
jgi:hypothetical protein